MLDTKCISYSAPLH